MKWMDDKSLLIRDKYRGDPDAPGVADDLSRLASGEPLAYVIGNIPFLGLSIGLASRPLIPRPETEWWAEELCAHVGGKPLRVFDLCAGSGAVGLSVLKHCPNARVSFGELMPAHARQIRENLEANGLDASRASIEVSDLFAAFPGERFDIIAANPPYIPHGRVLDGSVAGFEPAEALFSGENGLDLIRRIVTEAPRHLSERGELWLECDASNIGAARELSARAFARAEIRTDQYGRERLLVAELGS